MCAEKVLGRALRLSIQISEGSVVMNVLNSCYAAKVPFNYS